MFLRNVDIHNPEDIDRSQSNEEFKSISYDLNQASDTAVADLSRGND
jgi:hypothetical protein